jgi:hypothetical protein
MQIIKLREEHKADLTKIHSKHVGEMKVKEGELREIQERVGISGTFCSFKSTFNLRRIFI